MEKESSDRRICTKCFKLIPDKDDVCPFCIAEEALDKSASEDSVKAVTLQELANDKGIEV